MIRLPQSIRRGEVVAVTGASAGVGRAVARAFARRRARIGLIARGRERLERTAREVEAAGGQALIIEADVAAGDTVERAADAIESTFGPIDIWINNAMASVFSPVKQMQAEEYRRVTDVTYHGYVYGTLAALRRMLPRDRGVIVQVGSALCYRGIPLQSAYCAAKHAVKGFTESLLSELIHDGSKVHVTMVHLPAVNTPQFEWVRSRLPGKAQPVPPIYQPEVAAEAIVWAAHHRRRELYVGESTLRAVWGNVFAPGYLDRRLASDAYEGQQTDEPRDPEQPENLWEPAPGNWAARGRFSDRSRTWAAGVWLRRNGPALLTGLTAVGIAGALAWMGGGSDGNARRQRPAATATADCDSALPR